MRFVHRIVFEIDWLVIRVKTWRRNRAKVKLLAEGKAIFGLEEEA